MRYRNAIYGWSKKFINLKVIETIYFMIYRNFVFFSTYVVNNMFFYSKIINSKLFYDNSYIGI